MKPLENLTMRDRASAARLLHAHGARGAHRKTGIHPTTLNKMAMGEPVSPKSLVLLRDSVRSEDEFKTGSKSISVPGPKKPAVAWPLTAVRAARDAQLAGDFAKAQPLAVAMRLDDAVFVASWMRVAPIGSLEIKTVPTKAGKSVADAFETGVLWTQRAFKDIALTMVNHGIAFGYSSQETADDGTSVVFTHKEWPIENVKWNDKTKSYWTKVEDSPDVEIIHGDGYWTIYAASDYLAHQKEACILPGSLIFTAHLDAIKDWSASSASHGQSKIIGSLPEGVTIQDIEAGALSKEAEGMLGMLGDLTSGTAGAGVVAHGSTIAFSSDGSTAWQVFSELALDRAKAAARVWLGTDGILGAQGGAPGVDVSALFGVALTKVQGDVGAIQDCFYSGVSVPWTAINYGDSTKAPRIKFQIPDADADQKLEQNQKATAAFYAELKLLKENGFALDQETIDAIADRYGVIAPTLPKLDDEDLGETPSLILAPTTVAIFVKVVEGRRSQGLEPFGDYRDELTIAEFEEKVKAESAARAAAAQQAAGVPAVPGAAPVGTGPTPVVDPAGDLATAP